MPSGDKETEFFFYSSTVIHNLLIGLLLCVHNTFFDGTETRPEPTMYHLKEHVIKLTTDPFYKQLSAHKACSNLIPIQSLLANLTTKTISLLFSSG